MKPHILTLTNVGPFYGEHTVDFSELGEMFLICGKMGAGKTTIFDAMTYALYGKLPGSRGNVGPKALVSDFSDENDLCQIDFLFEVKNEKYNVIRCPSKKAGKTGKCLLYKIEKGEKKLIAEKVSEIDSFLIQQIGLTADEFSRIVLLPQGEFSAFLKQNSTEKQKTLSKLFPSEYYTKIVERVKTLASEIGNEKKLLETQLKGILENFNPQTYDSDIKTEKDKLKSLKENNEKIEKQLSDLEKKLFIKNQEISQIQKVLSNKQELENLLSQKDVISDYEEKISKSAESEKILPLLNAKNQSEKQYKQLILEIAEIENALKEISLAFENAKIQKQEVPALSEKLDKERITEEKLKDADNNFFALKQAQKNLDDFQNQEKNLILQKDNYSSELAEIEETIKNLSKKTEKYVDLVEVKNLSKNAYEDFSELQKLYFDKENYAEKVKKLENEILASEKLLAENLELLEEYQHQLEEVKNQNLAFALAEKLVENQPCPVCGSLSHPNVVKSTVEYKSIEEKIAIQEKNVQTQKMLLESQKQNHGRDDALKKSLEINLNEKILLVVKTFGENQELLKGNPNINFSDAKTIEELVSKKESILIFEEVNNSIEKELSELDKAIEDKEIAQKKQTELQSLLAKVMENLPKVQTGIEVEKTKISNLKAELSKISLSKDFDIENIEADFFAKEYELCKKSIIQLENQIKEIEEKYSSSKSEFEKLSSKKEVLESQKENRLAEKDLALEKFVEALKNSDFASENDVLASIVEKDELQKIKLAVEDWNKKVTSLKTLLAEEKEYKTEDFELAQKETRTLESQKENLGTEKSENQSEIENQGIVVANLEKAKCDYDAYIANQEEILEKAKVYENLNNAVSGENPKKITFDAWYLGIFLTEITYFASQRLKKMTEGRYTMKLGDSGNNRGKKGLDIEIVDNFTKKARSSDSLSGGETFLASLSLALALTDTVQNKKGGVQLDSLFIDEGFGSLDGDALENAIAILDEVRENRNVGIISHVSELKQRDFNRIEVDKSQFGSSIKVKIFG